MKKLILSIAVMLGIAVFLPASASAEAITMVEGKVTLSRLNMPVDGVTVSVLCNGNTSANSSGSGGKYKVYFAAAECPIGASVQATVYDGKYRGSGHGFVKADSTTLNIAMVDVEAIPELGTMAAATAFLGGGAFMLVRRRSALDG